MNALMISLINMQGGTQTRAGTNHAAVLRYARLLEAKQLSDPIVVFKDADGNIWLADGHHRVLAALHLGWKEYPFVRIFEGSKMDALSYALSANAGLRRTRQDKLFAIGLALQNFGNLSDNALADLCGVDGKTVGKVRRSSTQATGNCGNSIVERRKGLDGRTRSMPRAHRTGKSGRDGSTGDGDESQNVGGDGTSEAPGEVESPAQAEEECHSEFDEEAEGQTWAMDDDLPPDDDIIPLASEYGVCLDKSDAAWVHEAAATIENGPQLEALLRQAQSDLRWGVDQFLARRGLLGRLARASLLGKEPEPNDLKTLNYWQDQVDRRKHPESYSRFIPYVARKTDQT